MHSSWNVLDSNAENFWNFSLSPDLPSITPLAHATVIERARERGGLSAAEPACSLKRRRSRTKNERNLTQMAVFLFSPSFLPPSLPQFSSFPLKQVLWIYLRGKKSAGMRHLSSAEFYFRIPLKQHSRYALWNDDRSDESQVAWYRTVSDTLPTVSESE